MTDEIQSPISAFKEERKTMLHHLPFPYMLLLTLAHMPLLLPQRGGDMCCHYCYHRWEEIYTAPTITMYAATIVTKGASSYMVSSTDTMIIIMIIGIIITVIPTTLTMATDSVTTHISSSRLWWNSKTCQKFHGCRNGGNTRGDKELQRFASFLFHGNQNYSWALGDVKHSKIDCHVIDDIDDVDDDIPEEVFSGASS